MRKSTLVENVHLCRSADRQVTWSKNQSCTPDYLAGAAVAVDSILPTLHPRFTYVLCVKINSGYYDEWIYQPHDVEFDFRYRTKLENVAPGSYVLTIEIGGNPPRYVHFTDTSFMQGFVDMCKACHVDFRDIIKPPLDYQGRTMELDGYNIQGKFPNPDYTLPDIDGGSDVDYDDIEQIVEDVTAIDGLGQPINDLEDEDIDTQQAIQTIAQRDEWVELTDFYSSIDDNDQPRGYADQGLSDALPDVNTTVA